MEKLNNLCNDCPSDIRGLCCRHKVIKRVGKREYFIQYDKPCEHLNKANRCKIYHKRHEIMKDRCLTIEEAIRTPFTLPYNCKYLEKNGN